VRETGRGQLARLAAVAFDVTDPHVLSGISLHGRTQRLECITPGIAGRSTPRSGADRLFPG